jgi:hypothetical protein
MVTFVPQGLPAGVPQQHKVEVCSADGAIASVAGGHVHITKAGVCALTLAAPYGDGAELVITSETANAHTVTIPTAAAGMGASGDVGTFGGAVSDSTTLVSRSGKWWIASTRNVTWA